MATTRFNSQEIVKLLENLIGPTEAVGETYADERIMNNLKTLIDVTNWCLDGIYQSSETMSRPEWSMHQVGFTARAALFDYKDWLEEVLEENGED